MLGAAPPGSAGRAAPSAAMPPGARHLRRRRRLLRRAWPDRAGSAAPSATPDEFDGAAPCAAGAGGRAGPGGREAASRRGRLAGRDAGLRIDREPEDLGPGGRAGETGGVLSGAGSRSGGAPVAGVESAAASFGPPSSTAGGAPVENTSSAAVGSSASVAPASARRGVRNGRREGARRSAASRRRSSMRSTYCTRKCLTASSESIGMPGSASIRHPSNVASSPDSMVKRCENPRSVPRTCVTSTLCGARATVRITASTGSPAK